MKKFDILEHKADLKIRVYGKDKKELFENALVGMFGAAKYEPASAPSFVKTSEGNKATAGKGRKIKREIKISSFDLPSLLVDFLAEALYLCETKKEVYDIIKIERFNDKHIEGILLGKKLKRMGVEIKGVTYHNLEIRQREDGIWEATILFDI